MLVRNVLALVVGVFVAGAVIALVEMAVHAFADGEMLFVAVAAGYGLGALAGAAVAARLAPSQWPSLVVCAVLAALAISNLFLIQHPVWFIPVAAVALLGGFALGRKLGGTED